MLFDETQELFLQSYKLKEASKETLYGYRRDLQLFHDFLSKRLNTSVYVDEIELEDLEAYLYYLAEVRKLLPSTRNRYLASVSSMLNYAVKKGWMEQNPALLIDRAKVIEQPKVTLNEKEIDQLVEVIEHPVIRTAVLFLAKTGLRVNEMTQLKLQAVHFETNRIHVYEAKGGKYRVVPMAASLKPVLQEYLDNIREADSEYFFAVQKTGKLSAQYINRELSRAIRQLNWTKHVSNHTLRRSFATNLYNKNVGLVTIQKLLGHESLKTTSIYLNVQSADLEDAVNLL